MRCFEYVDPDGDGRLEQADRGVLGTTPLRAVPLAKGSYVLVLRHPGFRDVRYPVWIERQEAEAPREPIPLYTDAQISAGYVYVAGGEAGTDAAVSALCPRQQGEPLWHVRNGQVVERTRLADDWPALGVSWEDAQTYCRWRSGIEDRPVTLPTEAEWERAARGADGRAFPWGDLGAADFRGSSRSANHPLNAGPFAGFRLRASPRIR